MSEKDKEVLISLNLTRVKNAPVPDRREVAIRKIREKASKTFKGKAVIIGNDLNEYIHSNPGRIMKGRLRIMAVVGEDEVVLKLPEQEPR
jgi:ribosomal protein L31E